jgi:putative NADH-flavin reductase
MVIAVIGASAGLGAKTVKRAVDRNHEVIALARSAVDWGPVGAVRAIQGDALDPATLRLAVQDADAVVVTLGTRKNMQATSLFSAFARLLVTVLEESGRDIPVLVVTGFGTGESQHFVSWMVKLFLRFMLKDVYADKAAMEEAIASSSLRWTIVRPGRLLDEPLTERYRTETTLYKGIDIGGINRADVADYLVKQCEQQSHLRQYVGLANA